MNRLLFPALLFAMVLLSAVAARAAESNPFQDAGKRLALVIGVSAYKNAGALPNPVNDARRMGEALRAVRFEVIEVIDPDIGALQAARQDFIARLGGTDIAVLYYAGHSIQIDNENYLLPTDTKLDSVAGLEAETMALADLVGEMDAHAKTKIVVFDACRDNPFAALAEDTLERAGLQRSIGRGAAPLQMSRRLEKPEAEGFNTYGSIIAFAAAPGETASDGTGENSPYTKALIEQIVRPGVEVGQMFRTAAANVVTETRGAQKPEYLVRLTDEIFLSRPQPSDCDYFAIAPYNQVGIVGVEFDAIKPAKAIPACEAELAEQPDHPRFLHNLARTFDSVGRYDEAFDHYERSAALGYVPAINNLGVMYLNGHGTKQDIPRGVSMLKEAAAAGYRLAKIGLRSGDFTILFARQEYMRLQEALKSAGYYAGQVDGAFGPASKAALARFQKDNGLALSGGTLETLDRLGIVDAIPAYEVN